MTTTESTYPDATMRYGATARQVADVFEPEEATDSLVLLLHGGLWRDSDRMRTWAAGRALGEAGHLTATVEYRHGQGQWRQACEDVETAIESIQLSGREWTVHNDAPRRITLVGHSSGGQLALWAASRPGTLVTGVVALAPAAALAAMSDEGLGDGAVEEFLGGSPAEVPDAYAAADPVGLAPQVAVRILHGAADTVIPYGISERYVAAHPGVRLEAVDGADHAAWGDPASAAWPRLLTAVGEV
ncbi:alpha/beta hydrolase family protein [Nocardioides albertanoniae]|uniref:Alpha/beta hydrolase family protein n=1 Tax=Nocardioides albertanoniae TaxID=1175486 RepID=A0A543A477_9ACTN|nr:alpha/beta hydrolase [Nocardioides albertanoniae]TQL67395.1 alpha/beta hydrolase family protein [Nocardioides albertanoniae]